MKAKQGSQQPAASSLLISSNFHAVGESCQTKFGLPFGMAGHVIFFSVDQSNATIVKTVFDW
jgi:hypothetical protein